MSCCCAQGAQTSILVGRITKRSNIFNRERKGAKNCIWCMWCQKIMTLDGVFHSLKGLFLTTSSATGHTNLAWSNHLHCKGIFYHPSYFDNMPWHCQIYEGKQDFTSCALTAPQRIRLVYNWQFVVGFFWWFDFFFFFSFKEKYRNVKIPMKYIVPKRLCKDFGTE